MKILAVDDEKLQLNRLVDAIKDVNETADILSFWNPLEALKLINDNKFDVAFIDIEMPGINGINFAKKVIEKNKNTNIIFVTGFTEYALDALNLYASAYITKPVNKEKIKSAFNNLRHPIVEQNIISCRCFGNFEVFANNEPLKFERQKTKELFAYLIDRKGALCTMNEISSVLWEDMDRASYLRNLISDLKKSLESVGASDVFIKRHNECGLLIDKINCDYFKFEENDKDAISTYNGEYMAQYSWAEFTNAYLSNKVEKND